MTRAPLLFTAPALGFRHNYILDCVFGALIEGFNVPNLAPILDFYVTFSPTYFEIFSL